MFRLQFQFPGQLTPSNSCRPVRVLRYHSHAQVQFFWGRSLIRETVGLLAGKYGQIPGIGAFGGPWKRTAVFWVFIAHLEFRVHQCQEVVHH
jgi:hypothetical protein